MASRFPFSSSVSSPAVVASVLALAIAASSLTACVDYVPDRSTLVQGAENVEVVSETPNLDTYEPVGEISAQIIGREVGESFRQAANELRNKAAAKGATFVSIDDFSSRAAWDLSGRTVVTISGTAYRPK